MIDNDIIIQRLEFLENRLGIAVCPHCHKSTNKIPEKIKGFQSIVKTTMQPVYVCEHCGCRFIMDEHTTHKA